MYSSPPSLLGASRQLGCNGNCPGVVIKTGVWHPILQPSLGAAVFLQPKLPTLSGGDDDHSSINNYLVGVSSGLNEIHVQSTLQTAIEKLVDYFPVLSSSTPVEWDVDRGLTLLALEMPMSHEGSVAVACPRHRIQPKPGFDLGIRDLSLIRHLLGMSLGKISWPLRASASLSVNKRFENSLTWLL